MTERKRFVVREVLFEVTSSEKEDEFETTTTVPVAIGPMLFRGSATIRDFRNQNWLSAEGLTFQSFASDRLKEAFFEEDQQQRSSGISKPLGP